MSPRDLVRSVVVVEHGGTGVVARARTPGAARSGKSFVYWGPSVEINARNCSNSSG
jgi:hypothetical protein